MPAEAVKSITVITSFFSCAVYVDEDYLCQGIAGRFFRIL